MAGGSGVVMRWFDPEFDREALDQHAVSDDYQHHLGQLAAQSSDSIQELLATNLHDGLVQSWELGDGSFTWSLVIGSLRSGYELATIAYHDARVQGATALADFDLLDPDHRLLWDEVDVADGARGLLEHRFTLSPDFVFAVQFSDVDVHRELLVGRQS